MGMCYHIIAQIAEKEPARRVTVPIMVDPLEPAAVTAQRFVEALKGFASFVGPLPVLDLNLVGPYTVKGL